MNEWNKSTWFKQWLELARNKANGGSQSTVNCATVPTGGKSSDGSNNSTPAR